MSDRGSEFPQLESPKSVAWEDLSDMYDIMRDDPNSGELQISQFFQDRIDAADPKKDKTAIVRWTNIRNAIQGQGNTEPIRNFFDSVPRDKMSESDQHKLDSMEVWTMQYGVSNQKRIARENRPK